MIHRNNQEIFILYKDKMAQVTDPIAGNESFTTVSTLGPQLPELSAASVNTYNDEVHNYLIVNGHILSDARIQVGTTTVSSAGVGPPVVSFIGAATDVCGIVDIGAGQGAAFTVTVTYGLPYPTNQSLPPPAAPGTPAPPVVCISPQFSSLGTAFVSASTPTSFTVSYPGGVSSDGAGFSYIVMYPVTGPPNDPPE